MYWWEKAADTVRHNRAESFGFITTNSITQTFNRRVIQKYLDGVSPLSLTFAIPDHPWVDSAQGAAVRIAMSVARAGSQPGKLLTVTHETVTNTDDAHTVEFTEIDGIINADFTIGTDVSTITILKANKDLANVGMSLIGAGFIVSPEEATLLGLGRVSELEKIIKPYMNGRDLSQNSRGAMVIDLFGFTEMDVLVRFPEVYQHTLERVKPERQLNNRESYRKKWWIFGEPRGSFRPALMGLRRYIGTTRTAKHRIFSFLSGETVPDAKIVAIALDDAYFLGVLSSRFHLKWAASTGAMLEDRPNYNHSDCFLKFPFPDATLQQQARIRELAEQLDAHRKRQQAAHATLTLTDLYNVVEKLRAGESLNAKEQTINQRGLASVVLSLHQQIDAAVADAYGWPHDLPDSEILTRLVRLNHERAAEETAGLIRYLRPSYQAPGQQQLGIDLPTTAATTSAPVAAASQLEWPKELAQQMQAVRDAVQQAGVPMSTKQVAAIFQRTRPEKVQPLLDTLAALALVRQTSEGAYAM